MSDLRAPDSRAGTDMRWMRGVTAASLVAIVLIGAFLQLVLGMETPPGARYAVLICTTLVSALVAWALVPTLLRPSEKALSPLSIALTVTLIVTVCITWALALVPPFAGWGWGFLFAIAGGMLGCIASGWSRAVVFAVTIGALCCGAFSATAVSSAPANGLADPGDGSSLVMMICTLVLLTFIPLSAVWVLRVALRLDDARRTGAELAIATERLRFATDLHDIQGHHLQVIALKGELAERLLLAGETTPATEQLAAIRKIAQEALEDTRAVVHDYRAVTVATEARNAAAVLQSAGIECTAHIAAPQMPPEVGTVFALAIREAATNILRHSRAMTATIDLSRPDPHEYRLVVANDGAGPARAGGTGIAGLTARAANVNGTVATELSGGRFTLTVSIPVPQTRREEPHR
ncbi:MAG: sensor histidine kinase [Microbacteriaceae bacterium]